TSYMVGQFLPSRNLGESWGSTRVQARVLSDLPRFQRSVPRAHPAAPRSRRDRARPHGAVPLRCVLAQARLCGARRLPATGFVVVPRVTVEEMRHLGAVNRLLVELNAAPVLSRQDFPYDKIGRASCRES